MYHLKDLLQPGLKPFQNVKRADYREKSAGLRIDKIKAVKLFNRIDYDLVYNNPEHVSIFIAPNGCGKTTIFNFINFLLNPRLETLLPILHVPCESFSCFLSNGVEIELTGLKDDLLTEPPSQDVKMSCSERRFLGRRLWCNSQVLLKREGKEFACFSFAEKFKELEKEPSLYRMRAYGGENDVNITSYVREYLSVGSIGDGGRGDGGRNFFGALCSIVSEAYGDFLENNQCMVPISFISANRLKLPFATAKMPMRSSARYRNESIHSGCENTSEENTSDVLKRACQDTAIQIKNALDEYNTLVTQAKNGLPRKYVYAEDNANIQFEEFKSRWEKYHSELTKYYEIGLLEKPEEIISVNELKKAFKKKHTFLLAYLDAFEGTLAPLECLYGKLKLFADIFAKRNKITHKTLRFSPNEGISILVDKDEEHKLDVHFLSSGEKHDFIMFFLLIFKSERTGIIMIDEPEISLHIEWQLDFMDQLIEICKINELQAIVATHSPSIVSGHLELFAQKEMTSL